MRIVTLGPGHTRYVLPFPRLARVLGCVLLTSAPLMLLTSAAAGERGAPALPLAAIGVLDLLLGLVLVGGMRFFEAERARRQLLVSYAAFAWRLPCTTRRLALGPGARLRIASNAATDLHDVEFATHAGGHHLVRFANAASALGFARAVADVLQIEVEQRPDLPVAETSPP